MRFKKSVIYPFLLVFFLVSCNQDMTTVKNGNLIFEINEQMQTRLQWDGASVQLVDFGYTEELVTANDEVLNDFTLSDIDKKRVSDDRGAGEVFLYKGEKEIAGGSLKKISSIAKYNDFPDMLITQTSFVNNSDVAIEIKGISNNRYEVIGGSDTPTYWSFQGESTSRRRDWILPVSENFYQRNYMGMNNSDYGGGIPVTCLWRSDLGIAVGHVSLHPELVSLPVDNRNETGNAIVSMSKDYDEYVILQPGDTISTLEGFVQLYEGDCFQPLRKYSEFMQKSGIVMPDSEPDAFESMWCSWGYERTATFEEVLGTLPKVKELGIKWATVDDGYQIAEGDWDLDPKRFPGGDQEMIDLVKEMKKDGLKVQLWWAPLAADPGTKILDDHPEVLMLSKDGEPYDISWWNSYYMSPVAEATLNETKKLVHRFISEYDFDGLKLDGQHLNAVSPDYSENHPHDPEIAVRELPNYFKMIFEESLSIKPQAVIQNCPCGTCMSFYNMPYTNQVVSSDPTSSWQIRTKGLVYRAIIPNTAYFGDHVELSDNGDDFASSFGIGAVLGTKFTYPRNNPNVKGDYLLTPEKEEVWKKWFSLYDEKMLSTGEYIGGLYDIGYFAPEAHVIEKEDKMYYAFYADEWEGDIELRGLEKDREYTVVEYATDEKRTYTVNGSDPIIKPVFKKDYLIEVY